MENYQRSPIVEIKYLSARSKSADSRSEDRVTGIVETRERLDALAGALEKVGVRQIEVMAGEGGEAYLDHKEHSSVALLSFIFGDVETETLPHYLEAVKQGRFVFAVSVDSENAALVAQVAKDHGAENVVHFGRWVNRNY
jgi:precorrin-6B methylase 2